jgi:general secretion pathway protein D
MHQRTFSTSFALALVSGLASCNHIPGSILSNDPLQELTINDLSAPTVEDGARRVSSKPGPAATNSSSDIAFLKPGSGVFTRAGRTARTEDGPQTGRFTLNFQGTDLNEVVKVIMTDLLSLNYVVDPSVQGRVTLQTSKPLASDSLIPTLEMLLRMNNAALVRHGSVYNIVPREKAIRGLVSPQLGDVSTPLPPEYGVRIAPLRYIGAEEMSKILEPFVSPGNLVRVDAQRNLLILAGTSQELGRLLETIDVFDVDWIAGMSVGLFTPDFVSTKTLVSELEKVFGLNANTPLAGMVRFETMERLNALLVVTPKRDHLKTVSSWIDRLDRESGALGESLYIYHVQNGKSAELAAVLNSLFVDAGNREEAPAATVAPSVVPVQATAQADTQPVTATPDAAPTPSLAVAAPAGGTQGGVAVTAPGKTRIIADEPNNALLILATAPRYRQILAALKRLDIVPLQVLIEATIAEITLSDELQHGLEWFFKNHLGKRDGSARLNIGGAGLAAIAPGFSYAVSDAAGAVRAVLNTLATDSRLNVISSPSVMVLNNQEARIQVGDEVPITTQQQQSTIGGSNVVNTIEFRNTGVLLAVTPRVNAGGLVIMDVQQEVSDVAPGTGASLTPTIQQRKINSTVAVQSGQTVVLGGLIRENRSESRSGLPVLYRIPVLGSLFGGTSEVARRTELVVLITPRVVRNAAQAGKITREFREKMRSLRPVVKAPATAKP